ncbi:hypothetical protein [Pedobacter sp. ASV28]|uniref:hypothetical protein n=1 Tax=Pedobacter sp. ASV28 TaxID=2795123 RepID=UPI0018EC678E|nr:hypothetical protein [Pedobacter sp. ASV28]
MKVSILFLYLLCICSYLKAQDTELLPKDEAGKFIYYEVVKLHDLPLHTLKVRLLDFFAKNKVGLKSTKFQMTDSTFSASGKLIINKTMVVVSHPSGEVNYNFVLETKLDKYRFWLTDFKFIPYQKDRYGNFVPSTTVGVPLENEPAKFNAEQWKEYRSQTALYAASFAEKIKKHLADPVLKTSLPAEKKMVTKVW